MSEGQRLAGCLGISSRKSVIRGQGLMLSILDCSPNQHPEGSNESRQKLSSRRIAYNGLPELHVMKWDAGCSAGRPDFCASWSSVADGC
jgi:hypothetical protein